MELDDVDDSLTVLDDEDWVLEEDVLLNLTVLDDDDDEADEADEALDGELREDSDDELDDLSATSCATQNMTSPPSIFRHAPATFCPRNLPAAMRVGLSYSGRPVGFPSIPVESTANISMPPERQTILGSPPPDV